MSSRNYRLGRRQAAADRTRGAILAAARDLMAADGPTLSVAAVAERASVSRITIYNRFGSKAGLLRELAEATRGEGMSRSDPQAEDPRERLKQRILTSCSMWSADPAVFRRLVAVGTLDMSTPSEDRMLAEELAAADHLRPGCSLKEAEDVIGALTSFEVFDRLHKDGRRSTAAVTDILMRLAAGILA